MCREPSVTVMTVRSADDDDFTGMLRLNSVRPDFTQQELPAVVFRTLDL